LENLNGRAILGDLDVDGELRNGSRRIWTHALQFLLCSDQKITGFCVVASSPTAQNAQSTNFWCP